MNQTLYSLLLKLKFNKKNQFYLIKNSHIEPYLIGRDGRGIFATKQGLYLITNNTSLLVALSIIEKQNNGGMGSEPRNGVRVTKLDPEKINLLTMKEIIKSKKVDKDEFLKALEITELPPVIETMITVHGIEKAISFKTTAQKKNKI